MPIVGPISLETTLAFTGFVLFPESGQRQAGMKRCFYVVKSKASLSDATWTALDSFATNDNGTQRTVNDFSATGPGWFYQVEITLPP